MKKYVDIAGLRSDLVTYGSLPLEIKWTVSRGRDTWGFRICSLYIYGQKVADCNGGGYSMVGTVIADLVTELFKSELAELSKSADLTNHHSCGREIKFRNPKYGGRYEDDCYGLYTSDYDGNRNVAINGACGESSVQGIMNAIGYDLIWKDSKHRVITKLVTDKEEV
jgi:hypothetical protein